MNINNLKLPQRILQNIHYIAYSKDNIGCSDAIIYYLTDYEKECYLKIEKTNPRFKHEQNIMKWLQKKLPVPKIISRCEEDGYDYLLMTKVPGSMACSDEYIKNPEQLVKLLAEGILKLQSVNTSGCPYVCTLKTKLKMAKKRVDNNLVNMNDWDESTFFRSPEELFNFLVENQPEEEEPVFSHGDYCLPNIMLDKDEFSGFIDLGRAGIADKWQDIAICVRSLSYNLKTKKYNDLLFQYLKIEPNYKKIYFYILLDELF